MNAPTWTLPLLAGGALIACAAAPASVTPAPAGGAAVAAPAADGAPAAVVQAALHDAARRSGLPVAALQVLATERITWPDGSLGCARPGVRYTMAPVNGWRIVVAAGERQLDYRAGAHGLPLLCSRSGAAGGLPQR